MDEQEEMFRAFAKAIGAEPDSIKRLPNGQWTCVVRYTLTAQDIANYGPVARNWIAPTAFAKLFDKTKGE